MSLFSLEERLRPRRPEAEPLRDLVCLCLLAGLALLLRAWDVDPSRYLSDVVGQVASFYLLPALGFLLALRCGAIDLSVWIAFALGGAVPAAVIAAGVPDSWTLVVAAAVGLVIGAVNGALVAWGRLPSVVVTLVVAVIAMVAAQRCLGRGVLRVPANAFEGWRIAQEVPAAREGPVGDEADSPPASTQAREEIWLPRSVSRMLLVAEFYALVILCVLVLSVLQRWTPLRVGPRVSLFAVLCASGVLAGVGGACWLIEHGSAPVPTRPVADLRIPAAAILAGAAFLGGPGRALLAGVYLPVAMLAVTTWRQQVGGLHFAGYDLHVLALTGMVLVAHPAAYRALLLRRGRWVLPLVAGLLTVSGIAALAARADVPALRRGLLWLGLRPSRPALRTALGLIGASAWIVGAALWVLDRRWRTRSHQRGPGAAPPAHDRR